MERPEVLVGQIWQDTDKRRCERFVLVLELPTPDGLAAPLDARIRSCDSKGACMSDCPRMFISISRLRARFRLLLQPDGTVIQHNPGKPKTDRFV